MSGSQRAAADSDTAFPAPGRNKIPRPGPFALRAGQETVHSLRPVPPHRTRRLGHFPRRRKMSVPMRTTCGGPGFASARWRWTATRPFPRPGPFALRAGQENVHSLRPVPPHRTRRLGHFPRRRKMSVPMRTTCGGPGFASARWRWTATRPFPRPGPFALRAGQENVHSLRPVPLHRTRHLGHFPRRRKVSVLGQTKDGSPWLPGRGQEDRASPQSGGGGQ